MEERMATLTQAHSLQEDYMCSTDPLPFFRAHAVLI